MQRLLHYGTLCYKSIPAVLCAPASPGLQPWGRLVESRTHQLCEQLHSSAFLQRTLNQLIRHGPFKPKPKKQGPMSGRPQMKGIVLQVMVRKPKKPNSAQRKCCRVRLSNGKEITAYIPKEGHTLQEHNVVLIEGGRTQDVPGLKVKVIRGKYDCKHPHQK